MKWERDDVIYLEKKIARGQLRTTLGIIQRHPGLPPEEAFRLLIMVQAWEAQGKGLVSARRELLSKLMRIASKIPGATQYFLFDEECEVSNVQG
jgi:hypothetical protein